MLAASAFILVALLHAGLLVALSRRPRPAFAPEWAAFALVVAGLVYDNGIIAAGAWFGEGPLLEGLNRPRFWMHAILTPALIPAAFHLAGVQGSPGFRRARLPGWIAAAALVAIGLGGEGLWMDLKPVEFAGTLRYTAVHAAPPFGAIAGSAACLAAGGWMAVRLRRPWLLAGAIAIFAAAGLPAGVLGPLPGQFGEWLLCWAFAVELKRSGGDAARSGAR